MFEKKELPFKWWTNRLFVYLLLLMWIRQSLSDSTESKKRNKFRSAKSVPQLYDSLAPECGIPFAH